ncbi:Chalcone isomerase [Phytophthora cactorum]|nr:Chalcone isomerase [Phytophthora cactorum]
MRRSDGDDAAPSTSSSTAVTSASTFDALHTPQMNPSTPPMHAANAPGSGVLLLGKLMRRDRRLFTWKWRDFVLERTRLQYFSQKGNRKGDIPLTPHTPITIRMCSEPKPFGFLLFIKDTKLTLAAATERERHQWIDVFCDVFHASVEQTPADNKAERRAKPTYLPIPDLGDDGLDHDSSASNLLVHQSNSMEMGDIVDGGGASTPVMAHNLLDNEHGGNMKRDSFGEDVIPILESRMTYGPMKEMYSRITFPPSLANGDLLVGVGPIVRRMGWTDERILAVGMYIDPETATKELEKFNGRDAKSLYGDQQFYDHLLFHTTFRRSFVVTARKRVSKSVLTALLRVELAPRMGANAAAMKTFLGFIEKSLKKAESMVMRVHEDDRFEYRLRGQLYPPIASHALCKSIQALFFDSNSIQHDAKRGLVERLPSLWGGEVLDAQDEIFGSLHDRNQSLDSDDEDDSDSDDSEDDSEAEDLFGAAEHDINRIRKTDWRTKRKLTVKKKESTLCQVTGDMVVDGSALLGTWSHEFSVSPEEYDEPYGSHQYRFTVGLYVDPGAITESLLKYKGLSIGSIVQDTDYFHQFSHGKFQKHLVFKVDAKMKLRALLEYFDTRFSSLVSSFEDVKQPLDSLVELWDTAHPQQQQFELCPKDEARFSIAADGKLVLRVKKRGSFTDDKKPNHSVASVSSSEETTAHSAGSSDSTMTTTTRTGSSVENTLPHANIEMELVLPPPPFHLALESLIFGFHAIDPAARTQLMERVPNLLDLARDDLVHTYHDEIQALRENYKRQKPENRVKVGYLSISFEKRKLQRNAEKGGAKEVTMVPSRWSKRWCRLEALCSRITLTNGLATNSGPDIARFALEKGENDSIRIAIIKPNGEILALRTETIYEGEEWLESLTDASKVRRHAGSSDNWTTWDANFSQLRRRSSSTRDMLLNRGIGAAPRRARCTVNGVPASNMMPSHTALHDEDLVEKDGSLLAWVQEDPRHAIIGFLLVLIVYLASVMHRTRPPTIIDKAEP